MKLRFAWTIFKIWLAYIVPFIPCCPRMGNVEDADCILVQAFGRNDIPDEALGKTLWTLRKCANLRDTQTFTLLEYQHFDPGNSNRALARKAMRLADQYRIPVIAQWEIVFAIYQLNPGWYFRNHTMLDCIWPPQEGYFATFHVKSLSKECMDQRGCTYPLELAHPAMLARAVPTIWKVGITPIVESIKFWKFWKHELWVWDRYSVQGWTRKFLLWIPRETLGRIWMLKLGWIAFVPPR